MQKKGKNPENKQQKKTEKSEKEKDEAKWKQSKKSIKEICQGNYEKKRFIQSFKTKEEISKLNTKIKIFNNCFVFEKSCGRKWLLWRVEVWKCHTTFFISFSTTIIYGTINCDKYRSSKVAYLADYI